MNYQVDLTFEPTALGLTSQKMLTVTNTGEKPVEVSLGSLPAGFTTTFSSTTLEVDASTMIPIDFSPVEAITYSGDIEVEHEGGMETIAISGVGVVITSIDNGLFTENDVKTYPNPAQTTLEIDLKKLNGVPADISIINISGNQLFSESQFKEDSLRIDVGQYRQGLYVLLIKTSTSLIKKRVIIKR